MSEESLNESWNEQLNNWFATSGLKVKDIVKQGINSSSFYDYRMGRVKRLDSVPPENRQRLYRLTGLEIFKEEVEDSRGYSNKERVVEYRDSRKDNFVKEILRDSRKAIQNLEKAVSSLTSGLNLEQKRQLGLLAHQQYRPTVEQRANGIMEVLDLLCEEIDYFRTAPDNERAVLVDSLKKDPSSFGYATQIINALHSGNNLNSWMLMIQPPSRLRRKKER